jgi:hypothetical protein
MKTFNKMSTFVTTLLLAVMTTAYADDNTMTQTREMTRDREQIHLQTPVSDFGQSQNREQQMVQQASQNQFRFKHDYRTAQQGTDAFDRNEWPAKQGTASMDRYRVVERSMNRSATPSGAMSKSRR